MYVFRSQLQLYSEFIDYLYSIAQNKTIKLSRKYFCLHYFMHLSFLIYIWKFDSLPFHTTSYYYSFFSNFIVISPSVLQLSFPSFIFHFNGPQRRYVEEGKRQVEYHCSKCNLSSIESPQHYQNSSNNSYLFFSLNHRGLRNCLVVESELFSGYTSENAEFSVARAICAIRFFPISPESFDASGIHFYSKFLRSPRDFLMPRESSRLDAP